MPVSCPVARMARLRSPAPELLCENWRAGRGEESLELGEGLLDRVQVGTVGWQIKQPGAGGRDRLANPGDFVRVEIVHDDNVTASQCRNQHPDRLPGASGAEPVGIGFVRGISPGRDGEEVGSVADIARTVCLQTSAWVPRRLASPIVASLSKAW